MSKLGVGIGEDFPLDDENGNGAGSQQGPRTETDDRADYEEWKRRREAWRSQREEWRAQRDSWKAAKRALKEKVRAAARESFGNDGGRGDYRDYDGYRRRGWHPFWGLWALIPILGIVLFFSLVSAIFKAPFVILAIVAIAAVFIMHRGHRHDHHYDYAMRGRDYGRPNHGGRGPIVTPPPQQPQSPPASPPAVTDGK